MNLVAEQARVESPVHSPGRVVKLSKTERKVIFLISTGMTSQEVSDHVILMVSKRTVDFHLANIYDKLGVSNRVQALRELERRGIMPDETCLYVK